MVASSVFRVAVVPCEVVGGLPQTGEEASVELEGFLVLFCVAALGASEGLQN